MALFSPLFDLTFGLARAREALRERPGDPGLGCREARSGCTALEPICTIIG